MDKTFEPDDPMERIGLAYPVDSQVEHDRDAARTFIEEFALMGWSPAAIRDLFDSPEYSACFDIGQRRGAGFIDDLIAGVFGGDTDG